MSSFTSIIFLTAGIAWLDAERGVIDGVNTSGKFSYVVLYAITQPVLISFSKNIMTVKYCTGSLITDQWILSAAHCTKKDLRIVYRNFTVPPLENKFYKQVLLAVQHPGYTKELTGLDTNDIGLTKIENIDVRPHGKVSALDFRTLIGRSVHYYGFGATIPDEIAMHDKKKAQEISDKDQVRPLQMGEAVVTKCDVYDSLEGAAYAMICLRPKCSKRLSKTSYYGDSGGPLLYNGKIAGVALGGPARGDYYYLAYTAVSPYLDWVHKVVKSN